MVQESPTTVHVFWNPPDPASDTIGYQIYYTGPTNGSIPADDVNFNNKFITDLINGETYHISVAGKSAHLESEPVVAYNSPIVLGTFTVIITLFKGFRKINDQDTLITIVQGVRAHTNLD